MFFELLVTDDDVAGPAVPQTGLDRARVSLERGPCVPAAGGQAVRVTGVRVDPVTVILIEDQHVSDVSRMSRSCLTSSPAHMTHWRPGRARNN